MPKLFRTFLDLRRLFRVLWDRCGVTVTVNTFIYCVFLSNEASSFHCFFNILINCCILKKLYVLLVIKNIAALWRSRISFHAQRMQKTIIRWMRKVFSEACAHGTCSYMCGRRVWNSVEIGIRIFWFFCLERRYKWIMFFIGKKTIVLFVGWSSVMLDMREDLCWIKFC
jgi:hypothetical protein